jgi:methionyl-tRNA formyltransferase
MVEKPDAGDIVDQEKVAIDFADTALEVFNKVTDAAAKVLARSYPLLIAGTAPRVPMELGQGSYFGGRKPADGRIDWQRSAVDIYNLIRGVTHPYPGAFSHLNGKKLVIWKALPVEGNGEPGRIVSVAPLRVGTGAGLLEIRSLQEEENPELEATAYARQQAADLAGLAFGE